MKVDSTLSSVVLPEPVPPEMTMFSRASTAATRNVDHLLGHRAELHEVVVVRAASSRTCGW